MLLSRQERPAAAGAGPSAQRNRTPPTSTHAGLLTASLCASSLPSPSKQLRETILAYETASGLPSSVAVLDELAAQRKAAVAAARAATAEREAAAAAVVAAVASEAGAGGAGAEQAAVPQVVAEPVSGQPACSAGADGGAAAGSCSAAGMAVD